MRTGTFLCTVVNGKLRIYDRAGFDRVLTEFGDGEDLNIHVEELGRRRTRQQEKFFHGPVLAAFQSLGYTKQEAKDVLCLRFIPKEVRRIDGSTAIVPGRTSALNVEDYSELIDSCIQLAAENDIVVEDADVWRQQRTRSAA